MTKRLLVLVCIGFTILISANYSFAVMDGLVGAWTFDKDEGGIVKDDSGNGYDGELVGNAKVDKNGKYGSAVATDGTEGYVMIPDDPAFEFEGDFSLACWVWNETLPAEASSFITKGYHRPAANGGDAKPWYLVYFMPAGTVDLYLRDTNAANSRAIGKTTVSDGQWHHIVAMKDNDEVRIYIDGKEDGTAAAVDAKYGENDQPLVFMVHYDRWFAGMIDEVAVFDKALSEGEIEAVMGGLDKGVLAVSPNERLTATWGSLKKN